MYVQHACYNLFKAKSDKGFPFVSVVTVVGSFTCQVCTRNTTAAKLIGISVCCNSSKH